MIWGKLDIGRLRDLIRGPGVDTRRWVVSCVVDDDPDAVDISEDGVWLDCTVIETGEPIRVQWPLLLRPGGGGGVWVPPPRPGDLVDAAIEGGDPSTGTALPMLTRLDPEDGRRLPAEVLAEPDAVHIVGVGERIIVDTDNDLAARVGGTASIDCSDIQLGAAGGLLAQDGLVHGTGVDPYTGLTYAALNNISTVVKAKK